MRAQKCINYLISQHNTHIFLSKNLFSRHCTPWWCSHHNLLNNISLGLTGVLRAIKTFIWNAGMKSNKQSHREGRGRGKSSLVFDFFSTIIILPPHPWSQKEVWKRQMTYLRIIHKLKPTSSLCFLSSILSPVLPIINQGDLISDTEQGKESLGLFQKLLMKL